MTLEELYKLKEELLSHCVGMTYNMQKALEINKEIEEKELKLKKGVNSDDDRNRL
jgi:hypothetical protein